MPDPSPLLLYAVAIFTAALPVLSHRIAGQATAARPPPRRTARELPQAMTVHGAAVASAAGGRESRHASRSAYERLERGRMPTEIARARLVTSEKTYRRGGPRAFYAKVDQGFRTLDGRLVLVDTKNRMRVTTSDIVQLSAQAVAVRDQMGTRLGRVADYAYIRLQLAGGPPTYKAYRLYPEGVIDQLVDRYHALRLRQRAPVLRPHPSRCNGCAFSLPCRAARLPSTPDATRKKLLQPMQ